MSAKCSRDKTGRCNDPRCACPECMRETCSCESFTTCGILHVHEGRKQNNSSRRTERAARKSYEQA
jgi:hypothetical protein